MRAVTALLLLCCKAAALAPRPLDLRFDHVQIFADAVAPLEHYAAVEAQAGAACAALQNKDERAFDSTDRDVVAQLLWALQWRVVASCATSVVVPASHATHFLSLTRSLTRHVEQSARATTPHDVASHLVLVKASVR